jgi:O-antigen ligase
MNMSLTDNSRYLITILIGIAAGRVVLNAAEFIGNSTVFWVAVPFLLLLIVLTFMDLRYPLILVLLFRPLLDPLLELTKVNIFGQSLGVGALLNGLVIVLTGMLLIKDRTCLNKVIGRHNWLVFLLLCCVSLFVSIDPGRGFRLILNLLSYFCLFMLPFVLVKKVQDLYLWLRVLLVSGFFVVIAGVVDFLRGGVFYPDAGMRIKGSFSHPNILAFYLVLLIVICIFVLQERIKLFSRFQTSLLTFMLLSSGFLLVETKTRNALIALWLLLVIYSMLCKRIYLIPLLLTPLSALLIPSLNARMLEILNPSPGLTTGLDSFAWRVSLWESALPLVWKSPFIGHGLASFQPLSSGFSKIVVKGGSGAHNVFMELAFEIGIPGLIAYLSIHGALLYGFFKKGKNGIRFLVVALVISFCVISFADNILYYLAFNWYYWFFVGLVCVYLKDDYGQVNSHNTCV